MLISIVVPCFNEEASIPLFFKTMEAVREKMTYDFEYMFVNDGSKDKTLAVLRELSQEERSVKYLSFSRNFGKEAALYAGLSEATGEMVTVMDVDLQDPPEMLVEMTSLLEGDAELDCVGCRRVSRDGEPPIRSLFSRLFYKLINRISDVEMVDGARDFRLMRRQMVDSVLEVSEYNRFSKGIFAWVGYKTHYLPYKNVERVAGESSWNFWSLFKYSLEGIVNFSEVPLNIASYAGILFCLLSFAVTLFVVIRTLIYGNPVAGWSSMVAVLLFLGGLQLLSLGILGKYISKIFMETKKRPVYIVKERSE